MTPEEQGSLLIIGFWMFIFIFGAIWRVGSRLEEIVTQLRIKNQRDAR